MSKKILFISMCIPFEKALHAGGKTFNFYINQFAMDQGNEITMIAKVLPEEEKFINQINSKIRTLLVATPKKTTKKWLAYIKSINSKFNPMFRYGNMLTKEIYNQIEDKLKFLKVEGYKPDLIVLEWTSILLFIDKVKIYFPNSKIIASEHDVTFLGKERYLKVAVNKFDLLIKKLSFLNIKKRELASINKCDLVVTHNYKDKQILLNNFIESEKIKVIVPFYENFFDIERKSNKQDILFFGAMDRIENSSSAIWFIDYVLPKLKDCNIRFIVLGNKPPLNLLNKKSERVIITGFVYDIRPYFTSAMCFVAPLLLGAGIKVKVIEALSSGIPVLTNEIGIEGINANNGVEYFHCVSPDDYEKTIRLMLADNINTNLISRNAKKLIDSNYDLYASFKEYSEQVYDLLN